MFNLFLWFLWWMLTVDNCIDTKPMTPTSTTWSIQNIVDWPVMLCTLQEQKEVLWTTPTMWLHAWPGMVRRPITSIAKGEEWCGEATGLRTSLQTPGNTPRLQAKRNKHDDLPQQPQSRIGSTSSLSSIVWLTSLTKLCFPSAASCSMCLSSKNPDDIFWWYLDVSYVSLCQNSEWFIMPCVSSQAETDTTSELPDAVIFASSLGQACASFEWFVYFVWWVQHSCPN